MERGDYSKAISTIAKTTNPRLKVLSMGDSQTGKSCLIKRYCEERFISRYVSTIGVDFGVKKVNFDGQDIRVNFWDLSGMSEFFEVRNEFYKDSQAGILVFDVNSRRTFDNLNEWVEECNKFGGKEIVVALCGNKIDVKKRAVSEKEARAWAMEKGYLYFEVSANTGENVTEMFETLLREALVKSTMNETK